MTMQISEGVFNQSQLAMFILSRLVQEVFNVKNLLAQTQPKQALTQLWNLFKLLPPEMQKKLKDEEKVLADMRSKISDARSFDMVTSYMKKNDCASQCTFQIREINGKVMELCYHHLREGGRGLWDPSGGKKSGHRTYKAPPQLSNEVQ